MTAPVRGPEGRDARITREITERAIRRLDILEWLILGGAALLAAVGGGLVALLVAPSLGWNVAATWVVASALMLGLPGGLALYRARRDERELRRRVSRTGEDGDG